MTEKKKLPHLESIERISKIPVVETSVNIATGLYDKIKHSNRFIQWGFGTVEEVTNYALDTSLIALPLIEQPLTVVDNIVCKGLDKVQQRVPAINYPPEKILNKTKSYVAENIVQPVLKRADSVKRLSLTSAELAATRIDTALDVADKYVEKYLPDASDVENSGSDNSKESKTVQTIEHVNRLSRKLQRRLTKRTIAEARALRKQGMDTVQILLKLAEMMIRDPKQFSAKMKEIWANLSEDEPENQLPPANLEQLIAMITRETARRFVHLTNFSIATAYKMPGYTAHTVRLVAHETNKLIDQILKTFHLEGAKHLALKRAQIQLQNLNFTIRSVQQLIQNFLFNLQTRRVPVARSQNRPTLLHTLSPVTQSRERTPEPKDETSEQTKSKSPNLNESSTKQLKQNENVETKQSENPDKIVREEEIKKDQTTDTSVQVTLKTSNQPVNSQQTITSPKKQRSKKKSSSTESSDVNSNDTTILNGEHKAIE